MRLTNQQIGGAIFFVFSGLYGFYSFDIPLFAGAEYEPFTPRTLPRILSVAGLVCAGFLVLTGGKDDEFHLQKLAWKPVLFLLLAMLAYGFLVSWLGFLLATFVFLGVAFRMMGESRRWKPWLVSAGFTATFWLLLTQVLGIYLEPGALWHWLSPR